MNSKVMASCVSFSFILVVLSTTGRADMPIVIPVNGAQQTAVSPNSYTLTFNVTPPVQPPNITWYFRNVLQSQPEIFVPDQLQQFSNDKLSLELLVTTPAQEGVFILSATNENGTGTGSIFLNLRSQPAFRSVPQSQKKHETENVTFTCFPTGDPTPTVDWIFNGTYIVNTSNVNKYRLGQFGQPDFGSLTIFNLEYSDNGFYICRATNQYGSLNSSEVQLGVQVLPIVTVQPVTTFPTAGGISYLTCTVRGFPRVAITWQKNGANLTDLADTTVQYSEIVSYNDSILEATGTLTLIGSVLSTNGNYTCSASNVLKTFEVTTSKEAEIFVQYPPSTTVSATTVRVNQTFSTNFSCQSFGIPPPILRWYSNNAIVTSNSFITITTSSYINQTGNAIQTIELILGNSSRIDHEANYTCVAVNGIANYISVIENVTTELLVQVPPQLIYRGGNPTLGIVGRSITLEFGILDASPDVIPSNIEWQFMQSTIDSNNSSRYQFSPSRRNLTINNLKHEDEGLYSITVSNEAGIDTLSEFLHIEAGPVITVPPVNTNVLQSHNAVLNCTVTGEPVPVVNWYRDATMINQSTKYSIEFSNSSIREYISTLTINNVVMMDTNDYTCSATNIHSNVNATAHVEVQVPPSIPLIPRDTISIIGSIAVFECQAFGSPIPNIDWSNGSATVDLANPLIEIKTSVDNFTRTSSLTIFNLTFFDAGSYSCSAENNLVEQISTSSSANLTVNQSPLFRELVALNVVNQTQTVNMTCVFFGLPPPLVNWTRYDNVDLVGSAKFNIFSSEIQQVDGGVLVYSTLQIVDVNEGDTGTYMCTAFNQAHGPMANINVTNHNFSVVVQTSPIVSRVSAEIEIGVVTRNITLTFEVFRDTPNVNHSDIKWFLNDTEIINVNGHHIFSPSRQSLTIFNLSFADEGNYTFSASNIVGTGLNSLFLDIEMSPVITNNNSSLVLVEQGNNASITCEAVSEPVHITNWLFKGLPLTNSSKYLITGNGTVSSTLTIFNASVQDEGNYTCQVNNVHGDNSAVSELQVQVQPYITTDPSTQNILVNNNVTFTCCATGQPTPMIYWLKNNQTVDFTVNTKFTTDSEASGNQICSHLRITGANFTNRGDYRCQAVNSLATRLSAISQISELTVLYPPDVSINSTSSFEYVRNQSDSFSVTCRAFGVPTPVIYWLPGPLNVTSGIGNGNRFLSSDSEISSLRNSLANFNGSRYFGLSSQCTGSNHELQQCSNSSGITNDCSVPGSLCSIPCAISITSATDPNEENVVASTLTICDVAKSDELSYTCLAVNNITNNIQTPEGVSVDLIIQVIPIVTSTQTGTLIAFRGHNTTLSFSITEDSPPVVESGIEWTFTRTRSPRRSNFVIENGDPRYFFSQDRRSLTIFNLTTNDTGEYRLTASNAAGTRSDTIALDVQALPEIVLFTSGPVVTYAGSNVLLDCFADGSPLQNVTWSFFNLSDIEVFSISYVVDNFTTRAGHTEYGNGVALFDVSRHYSISGNVNPLDQEYGQLTITNITEFQAGTYQCTLTNIYDVETQSVEVRVQLNVSIDSNPVPVICTAGIECSLSCTVNGVPSPTVSWLQNDVAVSDRYDISNSSTYDQTNSVLLIRNANLTHNGNYTCVGTNSLVANSSATSSIARLTVNYPSDVQVHLIDTVVNETFKAVFECVIAGFPRPNISWYYGDNIINNMTNPAKYMTHINESFNGELYNISTTLTIMDATKADEGSYNCIGSNAVANYIGATEQSSAKLIVQVPPTVTSTNERSLVTKGNKFDITFDITRSSPIVSVDNIKWEFTSIESNAVPIVLNTSCAGINSTCYINSTCNDTKYQRYNFSDNLQTLIITDAQVSDSGTYRLTATNPAGAQYAEFVLTVQVPAQLNNTIGKIINAQESQNITISCTADGIPRPGILWFFNSAIINAKPRTEITPFTMRPFRCDVNLDPSENGVTSILTITSVDAEADGGFYICQASNAIGEPVQLQQPFHLNITQRFVDHCNPVNPCKNGGTCLNSGKNYVCQCTSNERITYGGVNCTTEILVPIAPQFIETPQMTLVNLFQDVSLTCRAEGQPSPVINWFKDNEAIPNQHESTYFIDEIQLNQRGDYYCEASNIRGTIRSNEVLVNIRDVVEYSANLSVPFNELTRVTKNLTEAANGVVDNINSLTAGREIGSNSTFFFIEISGMPMNTTPNVTIPIRVTIRSQGGSEDVNGRLRNIVETEVKRFGYDLSINESIRLHNFCPSEPTRIPSPDNNEDLVIVIQWPNARIGSIQNVACPCAFNLSSTNLVATRECSGDLQERGAEWGPPNIATCNFSVTTRRLCKLATLNSSAQIIDGLSELTNSSANFDSASTTVASFAIESVESDARDNGTLANDSIRIFNNVMNVNENTLRQSQESSGSSVRLLSSLTNIVDSILNNTNGTMELILDNIAVVTRATTPPQFLTNISSMPVNITLPNELQNRRSSIIASSRPAFYISPNVNLEVESPVIDFTSEATTLSSPINFEFQEINTTGANENGFKPEGQLSCVFWDTKINDWSKSGCTTIIGNNNVTCSCNHNTSFAILLDVSAKEPRTGLEQEAFRYISYIGLTASSICLVVTLITYIGSPKLRRSEASQLLINLCFALLGLKLTFFFSTFGTRLTVPLCSIVGVLLHYFFLVVFFIMAAESVDLFIKLVIVLGPKIQRFILKAVLISWIAPLFFVLFSFAPNYQHYTNDHFCGPTGIPSFVGLLAPFAVIYIFNWTIFFIIMISLVKKSASNRFNEAKKKNRKAEVKQQCRVAFTVSVLFGLGWGFGLFASESIDSLAVRVIANSLFSLFVTFQGVIIFILYVALSPNARNVWKKWILRKEEKQSINSSSAGPSTSRGTKQTAVPKSNRYGRGTQRGTLYHNVRNSKVVVDFSSTDRELTSDFDSAAPVLMELQEKFKKIDIDEEQAFMNPLDDLGDVTSLLSENYSVQEMTYTFPNPNANPSVHSLNNDDEEEEDNEQETGETNDVECSTFANPFLSRNNTIHIKPDEMQLLSQETDDNQLSTDIAITLDTSMNGSSLTYSQPTQSVYSNDDLSLIKQ